MIPENKRREESKENLYDKLHKEAEKEKDPNGYYIEYKDFNFLLCHGELVIENKKIGDCYLHKLKSEKGLLFRTITEKELDFTIPF